MKKLIIILFLILITPIFSIAEEENILGYKKTETISLFDYLHDNSKRKRHLKINSNGDVTYKGKIIITPTGKTINDESSGDSYLWMKIYFVANGSKPRKGCDERDTISNGIYGLGRYIDTPEEEYKLQIEKTIKDEFSKTKKLIDIEVANAKKTYKKYHKDKNKKEKIDEYIFIMQGYQRGIEAYETIFVSKLIDVTANFNDIENKIPATDFAGTMFDFLLPYFQENNIDYKKYNELSKYASIKIKEIDSMLER